MSQNTSNIPEDNSMKEPMDLLHNIQRVDAPPFLLTRISQRIQNEQKKMPPALAWSLGFSVLLVLALNVAVIMKHTRAEETTQLARSMNMITDNSLYQ